MRNMFPKISLFFFGKVWRFLPPNGTTYKTHRASSQHKYASFNPNHHDLLNELFPTGGGADSARALGTILDGLPFLPNCT